jgi:vancomycin aglycone glucosyltransferase
LRFLLATCGSRGDVYPMLALGRALARRGHGVVLAGPPDFAGDAAAASVDYHGMGRSMDALLAKHGAAIQGHVWGLAHAIKREVDFGVEQQFALLGELVPEADCVVAASMVFAARSCAERAGKPYRYIAFAPETFPSCHHPGLGEPRQNLPRWLNRVSWWAVRRLDNWLLRRSVNDGRSKLGLPPIRDALAHFADPACSLLATDAELAPAPPDVAMAFPTSGAMLLDDDGPLPEAVEAFLAAGAPPVYVGFGSMPDPRPVKTSAVLFEAIRMAGCRAIVFSGGDAQVKPESGPDILHVGKLPHARLFPRLALAVHHGGAGTCARVARAGIPQVIVPHLLDQFPWAARLAKRGLAPPPLHRKALTSKALSARIRQALEDATMRERAAGLAKRLAGRDGAAAAADLLTSSLSPTGPTGRGVE